MSSGVYGQWEISSRERLRRLPEEARRERQRLHRLRENHLPVRRTEEVFQRGARQVRPTVTSPERHWAVFLWFSAGWFNFLRSFYHKERKQNVHRLWLSSSRSGLWLTGSCRSVRRSFLLEHEFSGVPLLRRPESCVCWWQLVVGHLSVWWEVNRFIKDQHERSAARQQADWCPRCSHVGTVGVFRASGNTTDEETPAGWISQVQSLTSE